EAPHRQHGAREQAHRRRDDASQCADAEREADDVKEPGVAAGDELRGTRHAFYEGVHQAAQLRNPLKTSSRVGRKKLRYFACRIRPRVTNAAPRKILWVPNQGCE